MNRKIILLPLALSALVLAGCGETGTSSTSSSEETPTSSETTSSSEEVPSSSSTTESETSNPEEETWSTIADLKTMDIGASFTARAYWMGTCGMINEQYGTYNTSYVADGINGYIIYRAEAAKIDALELEVGKTVVEFTGTIANYVDEDSGTTTYECSLNTIAVVDDATGLEAPVMLTLDADNPTFTFDATTASRRVVINDAKVVSNETGTHDNVTVTFTVGTDDTEYTIFFDSRYTDTSLVAELEAGDTFNCESFVGRSRFESIDKLEITAKGGSTEEPGDETITPLADVIDLADDTTFTTRAYYVGRNSKAAEKGIMTYNAVYVADGATAYMIYNHSQEEIDALNLVPGESIVEFSGKVANYGGLYECRANSIKVVTDATGLEAPVYQTLDKDHADIDLESVLVSTKFNVSDATVKNIATSGNDTTITFTVGEGTKEYTLLLDQRYNDMTPVENLAVGDGFETETFLNVEDGEKVFTYIANFVDKTEGGSTEEPEPEPEPTTPDLSNPTAIEISAIATTSMDENVVYTTTGILEDLDHADQYGNSYLVDPETGATLQLYGNTTSTSAFVFDEDGNLDYVNPKDAVTTLADVNNGEKVTILFQYSNTFKNAYSVTTAHEACTDAYTVQLPTLENAAIEVNPTSGTYGTEATLTITPDSGFDVTSVTIDHGYGKETLKAAPYTFEIEAYNKVEVTLRDTSVVVSTYTLTVDNFENVSGYGNYTGSVNVNGTDVGLAANQIMRGTGANDGAIQMRNKDNNPSYVYNTVALPAAIVSIEVTFSSEMTRDGQFGISVGTSELANAPESISWTGTTYTYTPSVSDATYFTIGHSESGTNAMYIASIVITIAA